MKLFLSLSVPAALVAALTVAQASYSAELLVVTRDGCPWCARWRSEISTVYPKTEEGELAPQREIDITKGWPDELAGLAVESYTPSFILVENGIEIGRMRGYPGDEFFWFLLGELLAKLPVNTID